MFRRPEPRNLALLMGLVAVCFLAGKLGLKLTYVNVSTSAVWPCAGIAIAALLIFGYRVWPAIFAGAFLVNITIVGTVGTALAIATGNTLEALAASFLVNRYGAGRNVFQRSHNIFKFALFTAFGSAQSATIGTTILAFGGFASWPRYT